MDNFQLQLLLQALRTNPAGIPIATMKESAKLASISQLREMYQILSIQEPAEVATAKHIMELIQVIWNYI